MLILGCMAYLARRDILYNEAYFHITWQCHNYSWFLEENWAKKLYYDLLLKYKDRYAVVIYSYSFMDNHPHLTGKTKTVDGISSFMKAVNSQFAKTINKKHKRRGQVVMDRFKSPIIQTDRALLNVMAYGDLNAPRVGKVSHPREYRWCSYRYYALGELDPLITPAPSYLALSNDPSERQRQYRDMVDDIIRAEGLVKSNYSHVHYIGDPDWVRSRYEEIQEIQRLKRAAYVIRQRRTLCAHSPP